MKTYIFFLFLILTCLTSKGQDTLVYKTGARKVVSLVEIKNNQVIYKLFKEPSGPDFIEMKSDFKKIIRSTGEVIYISIQEQVTEKNKEIYRLKNMIKLDGLVLFVGVFQIGYERQLLPGLNGEIKYGNINSENGLYNLESARGNLIKTGLKFYVPRKPFRDHIRSAFTGLYFKPEIVFCKYSEELNNGSYKRVSFSNYIINMLAGVQFGQEHLYLDIYTGFGQYWSVISHPYTKSYFSYPKNSYSNLLYDRKWFNAFTFGIAMGANF